MKTKTKVLIYLIILITGWLVGQYPRIPSFNVWFIEHIQPNIEVFDKCTSITLLAFSLVLFFAFWHHFYVMLILMFFTWGFFGNALDEFTYNAGVFTLNEKISLLFALLTTTVLIWRHHRK